MKFFLSSNTLYNLLLAASLIILVATSWNAPISGDEYVHVEQARKNINYLKSGGTEQDALHTPISRLKHYGQSFDTITTLLADALSIQDLYRFRHVSNSIVAWLIILFSAMLSVYIAKDKLTGIITIILILVTCRFMGHAMNNLKDVPFAFSSIFSLYFIFRFLDRLPAISWKYAILIALGVGLGTSIRIGGLLFFAFFLLFTFFKIYQLSTKSKSIISTKLIVNLIGVSSLIFAFSYLLGIALWPWALENLLNPVESMQLMKHYPTTVRQIFEGKLYWSDQFPWYYLVKYLLITLPLALLLGLVFFMYFIQKLNDDRKLAYSIFLIISFGFPLFYAAITQANVYGGWRQMLFVFPAMAISSSIGLWNFYVAVGAKPGLKFALIACFCALLIIPVKYFITNYPYQYTYVNPLAGGIEGAYSKYEIDYYFTGFKKAFEYIDQEVGDDPKIVATNFIIPEYYKGKPYSSRLIDYYDRSSADWDYAVICNTFLDPYQLKNGYWPPVNVVYTVSIEDRPIVAVLKRKSKQDLLGFIEMRKGNYTEADALLAQAYETDNQNESLLLGLCRLAVLLSDWTKTERYLDEIRRIYPSNEWANEYEAEMMLQLGKPEKSIQLLESNIEHNRKFYRSYISLAGIYEDQGKMEEAVSLIKRCLRINPFFEPAYRMYGKILIDQGKVELGKKMLEFRIEGGGKYGRQ